jgi:hypothetical protein
MDHRKFVQQRTSALLSEVNVAERMAGHAATGDVDRDYRRHLGGIIDSTIEKTREFSRRETEKKKNERSALIYDAYNRPVYSGQAPAIIRPRVGYMPGDEGDLEEASWRWLEKAKTVWNGYTDFGNPLELYKPILYGFGAKILKSMERPAEETSGLEAVIRGFMMEMRGAFEQYSHFMPYEIAPALRNHLSAAEGATNIRSVYTYYPGSGSKEYPIYITQREDDVPTEELLRSQIEYVDRVGVSPYEDKKLEFRGRLPEFFDSEDGPRVLDLFTFFDYANVYGQEPKRAHSWATKEGTWITQQFGSRNQELEDTLPADLRDKIRVYDRPVYEEGFLYKLGELLGDETPRSGTLWYQWAVLKPIIYASIDLPFEPLERIMEKRIPPEAMRYLLYQKWKVASEVWRGVCRPRDPYLFYGNLN